MNKIRFGILSALLLSSTSLFLSAAPTLSAPSGESIKTGVLSTRACFEGTKLGKQEQANLEALKKQMDVILEEKEKTLNDMAAKLNDDDYLDSLSPEAETDLKRKFRALGQEMSQLQQQYMQTLQTANYQIVGAFNEAMTKAAKTVAANQGLDLILSDEATFFTTPGKLDISQAVIHVMDAEHEKEQQENKDAATKPVR